MIGWEGGREGGRGEGEGGGRRMRGEGEGVDMCIILYTCFMVSPLHLRYILYMLCAVLLENFDTNIHKFLQGTGEGGR